MPIDTTELGRQSLQLTGLRFAIGVVTIVFTATGFFGIVPASSRIWQMKSSSSTPISFPLMSV